MKKNLIKPIVGVTILASSVVIAGLSLNYSKSPEKNEIVKEKISLTAFEENDKKRSKHEGFIVEEAYINGEKVKIDVQNHGDHYHIIYKGKKYSLSKNEYKSLFHKNNKIVLENFEEKVLTELSGDDEIISYEKHGDHWHVKTKMGEFITYQDPSKLKNVKEVKEHSITTISKNEISKLKIKSYVKHGDHWHVTTIDGKEYITYENPEGKTNIEEIKEKKIAEVITDINEIQKIKEENKKNESENKEQATEPKKNLFDKVVDHGDHVHVWINGKEYIISKEDYEKSKKDNNFNPDKIKEDKIDIEDNKKELTRAEMEKRAKEIVERIIRTYKLSEEDAKKIKVNIDDNVISYPHGNHYHYEPIDKTKPYNIGGKVIPPEELIRNPEIENLKIIGPYPIDIIKYNFDKKKFIEDNKIKGIKNPDNFNIVAYTSSRKEVNLSMNGKVAENWGYLVLHGLDEKTILETIKEPEKQIPNDLYFKNWTGYLPEVARRNIIMTANFGLTKYKDSPVVLGPHPQRIFIENYNDYRMVTFFTIGNGYLKVGELKSKNIHYLVKEKHTWKEVLKELQLPTPIANEGYEFIEWLIPGFDTNDINKIPENTNTSDFNLLFARALFGIVEPNLGDYIPEDENNPLAEHDSNMPYPGDINYPYDSSKYVRVAFSAGEHGKITNFIGDASKSLVFIVRKGLSLKQAKVYAPSVETEKGYRSLGWEIDMNTPINEDTLFTIKYEKVEKEELPVIPNEKKDEEITVIPNKEEKIEEITVIPNKKKEEAITIIPNKEEKIEEIEK